MRKSREQVIQLVPEDADLAKVDSRSDQVGEGAMNPSAGVPTAAYYIEPCHCQVFT